MDDQLSTLHRLGEMFPDEKRHPIVQESKDWEEHIVPASVEWCETLQQVLESGRPDTVWMLIPMFRVLSEIIYVLGYERGKREQDDLSAFEF